MHADIGPREHLFYYAELHANHQVALVLPLQVPRFSCSMCDLQATHVQVVQCIMRMTSKALLLLLS